MTPFVILLVSWISLIPYGNALQVTPGSTCAAFCLDNPESDPLDPDSSNTASRDITCTDSSYENSPSGIKFKNCIDCLQKSNATSGTENDVSWFLYNVRYSIDVCLFGFPDASKAVSSPCTINWACQPLKNALQAGGLDATRNQLEYCTVDGDFTSAHHIGDCVKCLASSPNQRHMANFVTALKAGCEQKPAPGKLLGLSGTLFSGESVTITSPTAEATTDNKDGGFGITSTGAIVGISIGGALLLLGGIALFWIYHRRQKRIFGRISSPENDTRTGTRSTTPFGGGFSSTEKRGQSQMSDYELHSQMHYTNHAEYYKMLDNGIRLNQSRHATDSNNPRSGPRSVLPAHPAYLPQTHSRQGSQESARQPPMLTNTNKLDSYAVQAYLSAAEESGTPSLLPPPPPGPPPAAVLHDPSRFRGPSPNSNPQSRDSSTGGRGPSPDRRPLLNAPPQPTTATLNPPPPPPSTRAPKVPSLAFPSVSRIRVPKKYTPPNITVQDESSTDDHPESDSDPGSQQQADISNRPDVAKPADPNEFYTEDSRWHRRRQPPPPLVIPSSSSLDRI